MARTVADAALLLGVMTGVDPQDAATRASQAAAHGDYAQFLERGGLKAARLGIAREYFGINDRVDRLIGEAIALMKHEGATVIDPVKIGAHNRLDEPEMEVLLYEFKDGVNRYLASRDASASVHCLDELVDYNELYHAELTFSDRSGSSMPKGKGRSPTRRIVARCEVPAGRAHGRYPRVPNIVSMRS
jgi:amidase